MTNYKQLFELLAITPEVVAYDFSDGYFFDNMLNEGVKAYEEHYDIENLDNCNSKDFLNFHNATYTKFSPDLLNKQNDQVFLFIRFEDGSVLKAEGYYNSYEGSDWSESNWVEVVAKQKTITVYE